MTRRRRKTTRPVLLRGLELLTSTDHGDVLLPGLTITASADAVAVSGPAEQILRSWSWSEVTELVADEHRPASDGRPRQLLELNANERRHRFLVAAPDLSVFLTSTAGWRYQSDSLVRSAGGDGPGAGPTRGRRVGGRQRTSRRNAHQAAHEAAGEPEKGRGRAQRRAGDAGPGTPGCCGCDRCRPVSAPWCSSPAGPPSEPSGRAGPRWPTPPGGRGAGGGVSIMSRMARQYSPAGATDLPAATTPPAPAPPSLAGSPALQSHEIFGFAPYWTLPEASGFDVSDLTTIAYFSVDVNGDGSDRRVGAGLDGLPEPGSGRPDHPGPRGRVAGGAHGDVLRTERPQPADVGSVGARTVGHGLVPLVTAKNFDGVNFDFEGQGSGDQAGLDVAHGPGVGGAAGDRPALAGDDGHLRRRRPGTRAGSTTSPGWPRASTPSS